VTCSTCSRGSLSARPCSCSDEDDPLDDVYGVQPTIPHLTRSSLHRCLERHGITRLPEMEGDKPKTKRFSDCAIGYFRIDIAEVRTE
jgi:hypothetical protein